MSYGPYGDHALSRCTKSEPDNFVLQNTRHNEICGYTDSGIVKPAYLPSTLEPAGLVPDTRGQRNFVPPANVYVTSPHACSKVGADCEEPALYITVITADVQCSRAVTQKSPDTKAEEYRAEKFAQRVFDVKALLRVEGATAWKPTF